MARERSQDFLGYNVPPSLEYWASNNITTTLPDVSESDQLFDLYMLPEETLRKFEHVGYRWRGLDSLVRQVRTYKELDSVEKVLDSYKAELLHGYEDRYNSKISNAGTGIYNYYQSLLQMAEVEYATPEQKVHILTRLGYWEEAAIKAICDPNLFFIKIGEGEVKSSTDLFGASVRRFIPLWNSPNAADGRYFDRILQVLDYDGIVNGTYKRSQFEQYLRQEILLLLAYKTQGTNKQLNEDFWYPIMANDEFNSISHLVAVNEGYEYANQALLQVIHYRWKTKDIRNVRDYSKDCKVEINRYFEGKVREHAKYLEGSMSNVIYQQVSDQKPDLVVLLDYHEIGEEVFVSYVYLGDSYSEHTVLVNAKVNETETLDNLPPTLLEMINRSKTGK